MNADPVTKSCKVRTDCKGSVICNLQKHVRKVVGGFGKKSCVSTGVRKPGSTYASPTHNNMTSDVKVALNPNTTNQSTVICKK